MPLVTSKELLLDAQRHGYAVGAFNFENMEMLLAIVAAAEDETSPLILQTTPSTTTYGGMRVMAAMARAAAGDASVPVALHLDHGGDFAEIMRALQAGYTSVMIDASQQPLEDNIRASRRVTDAAGAMGIPVEAELGKVGGKEDDVKAGGAGPGYVDPGEAARFVSETGVDSLAVGIGTAHGFYKGAPKLALDILGKVRAAVAIPLVLHGASGLPGADIRACIELGICKVNFATELRAAYTGRARKYLDANPEAFDPKKFGKESMRAVTDLVKGRIALCLGK